MRRSSRIQIKQENTTAPKCDPISTRNKKVLLQAIENQQPFIYGATGSRLSKRRDLKKRRKPLGLKGRTGRDLVERKEGTSKEAIAFNKDISADETIVCDPNQEVSANKENSSASGAVSAATLLTQEESNDSIFSDVANSIKIDRTIKNLSPKKFFLNKNGKTTRSGRSFSPYDFATYSLLFGHLSVGSEAQKDRRNVGPLRNTHNPVKRLSQSRKPLGKKRKRDHLEQKRSKKAKNHRSRQYRRRNKGFTTPSEVPIEPVSILRSPLVTMKIEKPDLSEDLYSEEASAAFMFDFPPTPVSELEGHSLPPDFYKTYNPVNAEDAAALSPLCSVQARKWDQSELDALSKISLSDTDKYEFKSVFKDVQAQVANFENQSGHEVLGGGIHKFDLMESENVEGRRFYRKRITDSRLIAWHKYNLMSSMRYLSDTDPPAHARPIIKVRSNQCPRADLVWRLNQTLPPPSIEDVLDMSKDEIKKTHNPSPSTK